jgi:NADH:ubiquinone oxidoreductase subunit 6 (subunit J)
MFAVVHVDELKTILPAVVAGGGAVFVLLPRPKQYPAWIGALLGAAALVFAGATILHTGVVSAESFLFYAFSAIAVVSGALLVTQRNPARAALSFTLVILSTCGLFLLLAAPFLMAATIIIYAGAIIVTFLFVLMLAQQEGRSDADARSREPLLATITGFILLAALLYVLQLSYEKSAVVQALDKVLEQTRAARKKTDALKPDESASSELTANIKDPLEKLITSSEESRSGGVLKLTDLRREFENSVDGANTVGQLRAGLEKVEQRLLIARQQYGWLPPPAGKLKTMSDFSGPSANEPADNLRYDDQGRPQMPADNSAYLGRSLFADYLLPVELGGFLLLVAVIGSIAIAHRRASPEGRP